MYIKECEHEKLTRLQGSINWMYQCDACRAVLQPMLMRTLHLREVAALSEVFGSDIDWIKTDAARLGYKL